MDRIVRNGALFTALLCAQLFMPSLAPDARAEEQLPTPESRAEAQPADQKGQNGGAEQPQKALLTLGQCIDIALKKNQAVIAAGYTVEASRSRVGQARAGYYPQLNASAAYTRLRPVTSAAGTAFVVGGETFDQYSGSLSLNQNILDFGKTSQQVDISKYNLQSSRLDLQATEDAIILSVKQAYYNVLQARRNRDVAADVLKQFELHLEQAKGFYEVGTKAKIDVIKAEVDLSNARLSLINAENALKIAWVTLKNAMGIPDAPEGTYTIEDVLSFQPYAITVEEALSRAFENRPDLKALSERRQAAETNIGLARSGNYPALTGSATYSRTGETVSIPDHSWSAGVVLTVPLFSGFSTSHQVAEAKSNYYVLKANEESLRQQVIFEVRQAYLNLQAAEASISTAELAVAQAKENLDLANGRYAAGVGSPIEVSDAFATYVTAQANYTGALSNYKLAQANLEKAMGAR